MIKHYPRWIAMLSFAALFWLATAGNARAAIEGITGPTFNLTAKEGLISTADANNVYVWGYANGAGEMQYPGPTLIVNQGDTVTVNLTNTLAVRTSIVFPGQVGVKATGGVPGLLTTDAAAASECTVDPLPCTVSYTFTASQPGTYLYNSGTQASLQVEMGMVGALIVRPPVAKQAYGHADSAFDREFLFLLTEMDPAIHDQVAAGNLNPDVDTMRVQWYINGRNGPDTVLGDYIPWMPTQPYGALAMMHPGEKVLARVISAGTDPHPFHFHGNHIRVIAKDGRMLSSAPGAGADLAYKDFTLLAIPGGTWDALFTWTGAGMGWDMYGHAASDPLELGEDPADHGKPLPVTLPNLLDLQIGQFYSGSPYLGVHGTLPPGTATVNPYAGYFFMWHSHSEKELTNNDIFPGGMLTMMMIVPHSVPLP